ncbi:hypothetical protein AB9J70_06030 [Elizabethkingia anophelis]|uniref:hypothetical protein n=1 Tax=Elizabethkingia anophelis TaxID=1117645 RepID=UPI0035571641
MKKLDLIQMEDLQGGKHPMCNSKNDKIMAVAGAAATAAGFIPVVGWAIGGPTAIGAGVYGLVCAFS